AGAPIAAVPARAVIDFVLRRKRLRCLKVRSMVFDAPSAGQISQVISQSTGPAFVLGAVAGLISVLVGRLERILDRSRYVNAIEDETPKTHVLRADLPRLEERA